MRQIITVLFLMFYSGSLFSQTGNDLLLPRIDKRLEILCIAYKLTNNHPGPDSTNKKYNESIHNHFDRYKQHPFILHLKHLCDSFSRNEIDISSWELPSLAMHLGPPPFFKPLIFPGDTANIDGWDDRTLLTTEFISLLKKFYSDTEAEQFFKTQQAYFDRIEKRYSVSPKPVNKKWLDNFFGIQGSEKYFPVLCLQGYGDGDYIRVNFSGNRRFTHTIFGCTEFDASGIPAACNNNWLQRGNLHEYIHTFVNQLVEENMALLERYASVMLADSTVWKKVSQAFYNNNRYYLYESIVRAVSIVYISRNTEINSDRETEIISQEKAGFPWIRGLVTILDEYYQNQKAYTNFRSYMPVVIEYFRKYTEDRN